MQSDFELACPNVQGESNLNPVALKLTHESICNAPFLHPAAVMSHAWTVTLRYALLAQQCNLHAK